MNIMITTVYKTDFLPRIRSPDNRSVSTVQEQNPRSTTNKLKGNKPDFIIMMIIIACLGAAAFFLYRVLSSLYGFFMFILLIFLYGTGGSL